MTASKAVDYISKMEHGVIIAVGSGKQGKSCSLHSLIDLCWHTRPVYLLDPMEYDVSTAGSPIPTTSPSVRWL